MEVGWEVVPEDDTDTEEIQDLSPAFVQSLATFLDGPAGDGEAAAGSDGGSSSSALVLVLSDREGSPR